MFRSIAERHIDVFVELSVKIFAEPRRLCNGNGKGRGFKYIYNKEWLTSKISIQSVLLYTKYLLRLRFVQLLDVLVQLHIVLVLPNN